MIMNALSLQNQEHTLLVVDDNSTNLSALAEFLTELDFKVRVAQDGRTAIKMLPLINPDLILLDVMMPGMDGFKVCEQIKANEKYQDIPIIFMTALSDTEHLVQGFSAGAVDYITKPFQQQEVLARVTTHLRLRQVALWQEKLLQLEQKKTQELELLNAAKDKFFSIVSHDLRAPFGSLIGNAELMAESISDPHTTAADLLDMAQSIQISASTAYDLLQNLLAWSRLQRGMMRTYPCSVNVFDLVERVLYLMTAAVQSKSIGINNEIDPSTCIYTDQQMLEIVLRNLISNAVKYTDFNGRVSIQAQSEQEKNNLVISVSDTGVGISTENLAKLFHTEAYRTTSGTAQEPGSGLGLILCREMAQNIDGRLWAESEIGKGSTFYFSIPISPSI